MTGPGGDGEQPSDLEGRAARLLDDVAERLWRSVPAFIGLGLLFLLWTGFYRVGTSELGVVRTLGRVTGQAQPGLHYRFPVLQDVELVAVAVPSKLEVGSFDAGDGEALLVTSDGRLCALSVSVEYRVTDPERFTNNLSPEQAERTLAEVALTETVSSASLEQLWASDRRPLEHALQQTLQALLDQTESGLSVTEVRFGRVDAPREVQRAQANLKRARDEARALRATSAKDRENVLLRAHGEANELERSASTYAGERVERARADAAAFEIVRPEYARSPEVTRLRLQIETVQRLLQKVHEVTIVDGSVDEPSTAPRSSEGASP